MTLIELSLSVSGLTISLYCEMLAWVYTDDLIDLKFKKSKQIQSKNGFESHFIPGLSHSHFILLIIHFKIVIHLQKLQNRIGTLLLSKRCDSLPKYCTHDNVEVQRKTITEMFSESIENMQLNKPTKRQKVRTKMCSGSNKLLQPIDGYTPRFQYNGYVKKSHWCYYDENHKNDVIETEEQRIYRVRNKRKFCVLMGFAGGNYYGMQYNASMNTIEDAMFRAMVKNNWILEEHLENPWKFEFSHGSRTDRGVSAARMNWSAFLREFILNIANAHLLTNIYIVWLFKQLMSVLTI